MIDKIGRKDIVEKISYLIDIKPRYNLISCYFFS